MNEKTHAAYLTDLDYFQSQMEDTSDPSLYLPIAMISARLGNYDEVISVCNKGLSEMPTYTQLRVLLSEALLNVGRKDEAKEQLQDIIVSDEGNYKALKLLGMIYKSENDTPNAIKYFRAGYLRAPEDTELYGWLDEIGGLPITGDTGSKLPEEDEEFGSFDNDLVFDFNIDEHISQAKAAISDLMRDITGGGTKPLAQEPIAATAVDKQPTVSVSIDDSELEGEEISDDDILNALSKPAEASGVPPKDSPGVDSSGFNELNTAPESPVLPEEPFNFLTDHFGSDTEFPDAPEIPAGFADHLAAAGEITPESADNTLDAFMAAAEDFLPEQEIPSDTETVLADAEPFDSSADLISALMPDDTVAAEFLNEDTAVPPEDFHIQAPENVLEIAEQKVQPEQLPVVGDEDEDEVTVYSNSAEEDVNDDEDEEEDSGSDMLMFNDLREAVLPPDEEIGVIDDLPEIEGVVDEAEEIILEKEAEVQEALNSFNSLITEPPIPKMEDDERLEPIVPKNLVEEVLSQSGLGGDDPYAGDEHIDPESAKNYSGQFIKDKAGGVNGAEPAETIIELAGIVIKPDEITAEEISSAVKTQGLNNSGQSPQDIPAESEDEKL